MPIYSQESEMYFDLGRAALNLRPVLDGPHLSSVRAVRLQSTYITLGLRNFTRDMAWCVMGLVSELVQSVSAVFNLFCSCSRFAVSALIFPRC
jgi:hypothetical protein